MIRFYRKVRRFTLASSMSWQPGLPVVDRMLDQSGPIRHLGV